MNRELRKIVYLSIKPVMSQPTLGEPLDSIQPVPFSSAVSLLISNGLAIILLCSLLYGSGDLYVPTPFSVPTSLETRSKEQLCWECNSIGLRWTIVPILAFARDLRWLVHTCAHKPSQRGTAHHGCAGCRHYSEHRSWEYRTVTQSFRACLVLSEEGWEPLMSLMGISPITLNWMLTPYRLSWPESGYRLHIRPVAPGPRYQRILSLYYVVNHWAICYPSSRGIEPQLAQLYARLTFPSCSPTSGYTGIEPV